MSKMDAFPESAPIRIVSINVRGIRCARKVSYLESFIIKHQLDIILLQECNSNLIQFQVINHKVIYNVRTSDLGTALIYRADLVLESSETEPGGRILAAHFRHFTMINIYGYASGSNSLEIKNGLFSKLPAFLINSKQLLFLAGDFNAIILEKDITAGQKNQSPSQTTDRSSRLD